MTTELQESPLIQSLVRKRAQLQLLRRLRSTSANRNRRGRKISAGLVSPKVSGGVDRN